MFDFKYQIHRVAYVDIPDIGKKNHIGSYMIIDALFAPMGRFFCISSTRSPSVKTFLRDSTSALDSQTRVIL